jgi:predicted transcriptional regulator
VRTLQAEGPLAVRELARRLGRDVKRVHEDVAKLKDVGLVEDATGGVWIPYDEIRAELTPKRPAA